MSIGAIYRSIRDSHLRQTKRATMPKPTKKMCKQIDIPNLLRTWGRVRPGKFYARMQFLKTIAQIRDFSETTWSANTVIDYIRDYLFGWMQVPARRILLSAALASSDPRIRKAALKLYTPGHPTVSFCTLSYVMKKSSWPFKIRALDMWDQLVPRGWTNASMRRAIKANNSSN